MRARFIAPALVVAGFAVTLLLTSGLTAWRGHPAGPADTAPAPVTHSPAPPAPTPDPPQPAPRPGQTQAFTAAPDPAPAPAAYPSAETTPGSEDSVRDKQARIARWRDHR